jgi:hypothetical protein
VDIEFERSLRSTLQAVTADAAPDQILYALQSLGWSELVSETPTAFALLYDELGKAAHSTSLIDQLVFSELPPALARCGVIAYPPPSRGHRPPCQLTDAEILVDGWALRTPNVDDRVLVAAASTHDGPPVPVELPPLKTLRGLEISPLKTFDTEDGWVRITGKTSRADTVLHPGTATWPDVLNTARRAAATELAGLARGALALAVAHVNTRTQFGRTIGSFQAVRHRLADAHVLVAATDALLEEAWRDPSPENTNLAFAYAGRAHRDVLAHCIQVCGAMGLSWEHKLHRHLRRGYALEAFFGPAEEVTERLGAELLLAQTT